MTPSSGEQAPLVRIGRQSFRARMLLAAGGSGTSAGVIAAGTVPGLVRTALPGTGIGAVIALTVGFTVLVGVAGVAVAALLAPGLQASRDGLHVRVGRRVFKAEAMSSATLQIERAMTPSRELLLQLRAPKVRTAVWLRSRRRVLLSEEEQQVLSNVIAASSIRPPRSSFDPGGRFTHTNFPGALTKEEALELVDKLTDRDARLPITG
ncbi:hypothetical protein [Amnibacterium kyonggiense]